MYLYIQVINSLMINFDSVFEDYTTHQIWESILRLIFAIFALFKGKLFSSFFKLHAKNIGYNLLKINNLIIYLNVNKVFKIGY